MDNRFKLLSQIKKGIKNPIKIVEFLKHKIRNYRINDSDFIKFYSNVVNDNSKKINPELAIGSISIEHWKDVGQFQFEYLLKHNIKPDSKFLDLGCGNLRLGVHLIPFLNDNCYYGLDISSEVLFDAQKKIAQYQLQNKMPHLYVINGIDYSFLPLNYFDFIQAHSVFSHLPLELIEKVILSAKPILKKNGIFDFTYFESDDKQRNFHNEDFYYPSKMLLEIGIKCGFEAIEMNDWNYPQKKIRLILNEK